MFCCCCCAFVARCTHGLDVTSSSHQHPCQHITHTHTNTPHTTRTQLATIEGASVDYLLSAYKPAIRDAYAFKPQKKQRDVILLDWLAACEAAGHAVPIKRRWYLVASPRTQEMFGHMAVWCVCVEGLSSAGMCMMMMELVFVSWHTCVSSLVTPSSYINIPYHHAPSTFTMHATSSSPTPQDVYGNHYLSDDYTPEEYARVFDSVLVRNKTTVPSNTLAMPDTLSQASDTTMPPVALQPHVCLGQCVLLMLTPPGDAYGDCPATHAVIAKRIALQVCTCGVVWCVDGCRCCGAGSVCR